MKLLLDQGVSRHAVDLLQLVGIDAVHVPYTGAAPSMQAVLAGDIAYSFEHRITEPDNVEPGLASLRALPVSARRAK